MIIIKNTCVNQQSQAQMFMIKHIILLIKNKFKKFKKKIRLRRWKITHSGNWYTASHGNEMKWIFFLLNNVWS